MDAIRQWLSGKKAYFTALIGVCTAVILWGQKEIELPGLLMALGVALETVFIRAGIAKAEKGK